MHTQQRDLELEAVFKQAEEKIQEKRKRFLDLEQYDRLLILEEVWNELKDCLAKIRQNGQNGDRKKAA